MHREHDRDDHVAQDVAGALHLVPFAFGAAPAERQRAVDLAPPAGRMVAGHRQIGQQRQIHEQRAADEVGGDGRHIPEQRRAEVRPQLALVGDRHHVEQLPDATHVDDREQRGDRQAEQREQLGSARNRAAEIHVQQAQRGGDERPRVADADEVDQVGDVGAPHHRAVEARDADAGEYLDDPGGEEGQSQPAQGEHGHPKRPPGFVHRLQDDGVVLRRRERIEEQMFFAPVFDLLRQVRILRIVRLPERAAVCSTLQHGSLHLSGNKPQARCPCAPTA